MKAMALTYFTGEAKLVEVKKPIPNKDQVLVQVKYSALDTAADAVLQKTWIGYGTHARTSPLLLGWHYSGTVVVVGDEVEHLAKGDDVFGFLPYAPTTKQGAFSEYITVKENECAKKPDSINHDLAAASTTEALTALQAMRDKGDLVEGKSLLVVGAGGGVGSLAVSIANRLGAHVTAVCSQKDEERVENFGADVVIDRSRVDVLKQNTKYDVIFDTPQALSPRKAMEKLNPGGTYVTTLPSWGLLGGMFVSLFTSKGVKLIGCLSKKEDLKLVGNWLALDGLQVDIDLSYDVKDMEKALERQKSRGKVGRVVIKVEDGWQ